MSGNKTSFSDFVKFDTLILLFKILENGNRQAGGRIGSPRWRFQRITYLIKSLCKQTIDEARAYMISTMM